MPCAHRVQKMSYPLPLELQAAQCCPRPWMLGIKLRPFREPYGFISLETFMRPSDRSLCALSIWIHDAFCIYNWACSIFSVNCPFCLMMIVLAQPRYGYPAFSSYPFAGGLCAAFWSKPQGSGSSPQPQHLVFVQFSPCSKAENKEARSVKRQRR